MCTVTISKANQHKNVLLISKRKYDRTSVVDPNTLNLDPDPGFWPNFDPDLDPNPDPGLYNKF